MTVPQNIDNYLEALHLLEIDTTFRSLVETLGRKTVTNGTVCFVPCSLDQLSAYKRLEGLGLVTTATKELRLANDGRIKDGFIECELSESFMNVYSAAAEDAEDSG